MKALLTFALAFCLTSCAVIQKTPQQRHPANASTGDPGSTTALDADTYDALLVAHAAIEQTKTDLAANKYSATTAATVTTVLRATITAYDLAQAAYVQYHASQTSTPLAADLTTKKTVMTAAVSQLAATTKGP
jgi:hypothetical protein